MISRRIFLKTHAGKKYYKDCQATEIFELCGEKRKQGRTESLGNTVLTDHDQVLISWWPRSLREMSVKSQSHRPWASVHGHSFCFPLRLPGYSSHHPFPHLSGAGPGQGLLGKNK